MADTPTPTSSGFLSGIGDLFGAAVNNSGGIASVIGAIKGGTPATQTSNLQYDAFGRLPGQAGYGTATAPAATTATGLAALSTPVKIAIAAGILALGFMLFQITGRRRK